MAREALQEATKHFRQGSAARLRVGDGSVDLGRRDGIRDRWDDVEVSDFVAPTTREDLAARLDGLGVHGGSFHLFGGHVDDAVVMDKRPDGWVVFYSERGGESALTRYDNEADACADLFTRVTGEEHAFFDLVAGPAPAAEADADFDVWLGRWGISRSDSGPGDWKFDDVPWVAGAYWRRYFMRITTIRRLREIPHEGRGRGAGRDVGAI